MVQFKDRVTWNQARMYFFDKDIINIWVAKAKDINNAYEYVHKEETRVNDGILIDLGEFNSSGGQTKAKRGVSLEEIIDYFEAGGDIREIHTKLGASVFRQPYNKIYDTTQIPACAE